MSDFGQAPYWRGVSPDRSGLLKSIPSADIQCRSRAHHLTRLAGIARARHACVKLTQSGVNLVTLRLSGFQN